jgi:cyclohexyl-isocyanide hydratase
MDRNRHGEGGRPGHCPGAAGLLRGRRATTPWTSLDLLPYFGASPVDERVDADGNMILTARVTAGIDVALRLAAELRGTVDY